MEDFLRVGIIKATHGVKGEMKVIPTTDDPKRFKKLGDVFLEKDGKRSASRVEGVRFQGNLVLLKLEGIDCPEDAAKLRGSDIYINRVDAAALNDNEYYIADLIGMSVVSTDGRALGTIKDVLETGANDVYVVGKADGKELLIPAIKDCIKDVDTEGGRMTVHLLKGLDDGE